MHSICKYTGGLTTATALRGKVFAFRGDRDSFGNDPYCIKLLDTAGKQKKCCVVEDNIQFGLYYGRDDIDRLKVYEPPTTATQVDKILPRCLVLPGDLGKRSVSGRMTLFELYEAASDMTKGSNPPLMADNLKLLKEWAIAAAQVKPSEKKNWHYP